MPSLTPPNLVPSSGITGADYVVMWPSAAGGPLQKLPYTVLVGALQTSFTGTFLKAANNLSDVGNPTTARANLGLGTAATANIGTFGNVVPVLNASNTFGDGTQILQSGVTPVAVPLHVLNSNTWIAAQGAEVIIDPTSSGNGAILRSMANARANDADFELFVYNGGVQVQAAAVSPAGAWQLTGYHNAGVLQNDTSGNVTSGFTNPARPSFAARLSADINNVTGDGSSYTVAFPVKDWDQANNFNTASGVFTAPVAGTYQFNAYVTFNGLTSAHTRAFLFINTTGKTFTFQYGNPWAMSAVGTGLQGAAMSCLAKMNAADTAFLQVQVMNGTKVVGLNSNAGDGAAHPTCHFSGILL